MIRVLQLNVWTGRMKGALKRFLSENEYDIICMQEAVWSDEAPEYLAHLADTVDELKAVSGLEYDARLSNWGIQMLGGEATMQQGNVILSRWPIESVEEKFVHGEYKPAMNFVDKNGASDDQPWAAIKVKLENGLTVLNYHGYWQPNPIGNEETVRCMREVADMIRGEKEKVLMCGDLNVSSESPAMRELDFLTDLTKETGTKQTLMNLKFVGDVACDHILISDDIKWSDFTVRKEVISDHAAVSVNIEI